MHALRSKTLLHTRGVPVGHTDDEFPPDAPHGMKHTGAHNFDATHSLHMSTCRYHVTMPTPQHH